LIKKARERGIPVLGICLGMAYIVAAFGGKMKMLSGTSMQLHDNKSDKLRIPVHSIQTVKSTLLDGIISDSIFWHTSVKKNSIENKNLFFQKIKNLDTNKKLLTQGILLVNSTHWREVIKFNNCVDEDGWLEISAYEITEHVIEAVETRHGGAAPMLGIQRHPEYIPLRDENSGALRKDYPPNRRILIAFSECATTYANKCRLLQNLRTSNTRNVVFRAKL